MPPLSNQRKQRELDLAIWNASAGLTVQNHLVGSLVYYFPQGHAEHSASPADLSSLINVRCMVLCKVVSMRLLANQDTDEVYSEIVLEPIMGRKFPEQMMVRDIECDGGGGGGGGEKKVVSYAKILTPSDANNGGGFSVPRFCADSIFPPLNFEAEPPVQTISVTDVHGVVWEFRHIFRGTPRRHLLTTGWSKFVNYKKLVAGDSVVFMKNKRTGELYVGIRRAARISCNADCGKWSCGIAGEEVPSGEGFSRTSKGRISAESVLKAAELAGANKPFQVVYYPNAGTPDFVVSIERVQCALRMNWTAGMRFKLAMESEDSSRMTCFYGTVSSAVVPNHGLFQGSPWRMLQVSWDDSEVLKNMQCVNPWQVEFVEATHPLHTPFPPAKKLRGPHNHEFLIDGEGAPFFPMTGFTNSMMGHLSSSMFEPSSFPVGMQGARQSSIGLSGFSNFLTNTTHQMYSDHPYSSAAPQLSSVSTELNIATASHNLSPQSQGSVNFVGKERVSNQRASPVTKSGKISFQLFGKIIQTNEPVEADQNSGGGTADDGSKQYEENQGLINLLDPSVSFPYKKMHTSFDTQYQIVVEACTR